eukprot:5730-Heterococcus_DN1.PRE.4
MSLILKYVKLTLSTIDDQCCVLVAALISSDTTASTAATAVRLTHSTRWPQYSHTKAIDLASCVKYCWIMPALALDAQSEIKVDKGVAQEIECECVEAHGYV